MLQVEYVRSENNKKKRKADVRDIEIEPSFHNSALIKFLDTRNRSSIILNNQTNDKHFDYGKTLKSSSSSSSSKVINDSGQSDIPKIKVEKKWKVISAADVPQNGVGGGGGDDNNNVVKVFFSCGIITGGGHFGVRLTGHNKELNNLTNKNNNNNKLFRFNEEDLKIEEVCRKKERENVGAEDFPFFFLNNFFFFKVESNLSIVGLDVRWPPSILSISPRHLETYPNVSVTALLQFTPTKCSPIQGSPVPETWLDLIFCGHSLIGCSHRNSSHHQVRILFFFPTGNFSSFPV